MKITLPFRRFKNPNLTDVEPINSFNPKISHIGLNDNCCELLRILSVFFKETNVWKKGTSEYYPDYNKLTKEQKCFVMALRYNDISTAYIVLQNILGTKNYALHSQYQSQIDRIYKLKSMVFTRPIRTIKKLIK